jgi:hypothetical protein
MELSSMDLWKMRRNSLLTHVWDYDII